MGKITEMLKEGGVYSLTRTLSIVSFLVFLVGSCYLLWKGQTWGNYETFATMTGGGGAVTQIANKLINSRFNSPPGEVGKKISNDENGEKK